MRCTLGSTDSYLRIPVGGVIIEGECTATRKDSVPMVNVQPFGICSATGGPCVPVTTMWLNSIESVTTSDEEMITTESILPCAVGGVISVSKTQESVETA